MISKLMLASPLVLGFDPEYYSIPFSNCYWTNEAVKKEYLLDEIYDLVSSGFENVSTQSLWDHLKTLTPFELILESVRMEYIYSEAYSFKETFWADQAYQMAEDPTLGQALYDYLMSFDVIDRGTMYSALQILNFSEVPQDTPTYWADKGY